MSKVFQHETVGAEQTIVLNELNNLFASVAARVQELAPDGRYKSLALTALEESSMWVNKAVAKNWVQKS